MTKHILIFDCTHYFFRNVLYRTDSDYLIMNNDYADMVDDEIHASDCLI